MPCAYRATGESANRARDPTSADERPDVAESDRNVTGCAAQISDS